MSQMAFLADLEISQSNTLLCGLCPSSTPVPLNSLVSKKTQTHFEFSKHWYLVHQRPEIRQAIDVNFTDTGKCHCICISIIEDLLL